MEQNFSADAMSSADDIEESMSLSYPLMPTEEIIVEGDDSLCCTLSTTFCVAFIVSFIVAFVMLSQQSSMGSTSTVYSKPGNGAPDRGSPGQKPSTRHASSTQTPKRETTNAIPTPTTSSASLTLSPPTAIPAAVSTSGLSIPTTLKPTYSTETPSILPASTAVTNPVITNVPNTTSSSTSTTSSSTSTTTTSTSSTTTTTSTTSTTTSTTSTTTSTTSTTTSTTSTTTSSSSTTTSTTSTTTSTTSTTTSSTSTTTSTTSTTTSTSSTTTSTTSSSTSSTSTTTSSTTTSTSTTSTSTSSTSTTTSSTSTSTSTSSTSTSTTSSPIGTASTPASPHTERLLVCVTSDVNEMPQNLCDVLLLECRDRFPFKRRQSDVEKFATANAVTCRGTKCGIDMPILVPSKSLQDLQTTNGRDNLAWFGRNNLPHFAQLNIKLFTSNNDAQIDDIISFFKGLRDEQTQMQTRGLHIIGVIPAVYDAADTINDEMRSQLLRYARELSPDALLVRTSQREEIVGVPSCRLNAPSLWTHLANVIGQPSFVQSLELIKTVQLPSDLPILLSFTCARYMITYRGIPRGLANDNMDLVSNKQCQKCQINTLSLWFNWVSNTLRLVHNKHKGDSRSPLNCTLARSLQNYLTLFSASVQN